MFDSATPSFRDIVRPCLIWNRYVANPDQPVVVNGAAGEIQYIKGLVDGQAVQDRNDEQGKLFLFFAFQLSWFHDAPLVGLWVSPNNWIDTL